MTRHSKAAFFFFTTVLAVLFACADTPAQTPHFRNHTLPPEFKSTEVSVIYQDSRGFIWLGTDNGVVRYDGFEFRHFLQRVEFGNDVTALFEDDSLNLWIGYRTGRIARIYNDLIMRSCSTP